MNKVVLIALLLGYLSTTGLAQKESRKHDPKDIITKIEQDLNLSDAQKKPFEELMMASFEQREALRGKDLSKEEKRTVMQANSKEMDEQLSNILTDEQYQKFTLLRKEYRAERNEKGGGKFQRIERELNLSKDQVEPFETIIKNSMEQRQAIKEMKLTQDDHKLKMEAVNKTESSEMLELLTQEQFEKYIQLRKERRTDHSKGNQQNPSTFDK